MKETLFQKMKMLKLKDFIHLILYVLAIIPAKIYRRKRQHMWLVCETENEARDNGYWLFKYLREEQPQIDAVYAINSQCSEYQKVAPLGNTVEYGSLKHWIYYLAAEVNISSQKYGKPNAAVCYLMEVVLGILKNTRVFLQHGVTQRPCARQAWIQSPCLCCVSCVTRTMMLNFPEAFPSSVKSK